MGSLSHRHWHPALVEVNANMYIHRQGKNKKGAKEVILVPSLYQVLT